METYTLAPYVPSREDYEELKERRRTMKARLSPLEARLFDDRVLLMHALLRLKEARDLVASGHFGRTRPSSFDGLDQPQPETCPRPEDFGDYITLSDDLEWSRVRAMQTHFQRCYWCIEHLLEVFPDIVRDLADQVGPEAYKQILAYTVPLPRDPRSWIMDVTP